MPGTAAAVCVGDRGGVADDENIGMTGHRQIGHDLDSAGAVGFGVEPARRRRSDDARGPDDGRRIEPAAVEIDAVCVATGYARVGFHLDAGRVSAVRT